MSGTITAAMLDRIYSSLVSFASNPEPLTEEKFDRLRGVLKSHEMAPCYCLILSLGAKFNLLGGTRYFRKRRLRYLRRGGKP